MTPPNGSYLRRLTTFDTVTPLSLQTRDPGVYNEPFLIEGNSILSSIFIESCDPGATLHVSYWDSTTGTEVGEEYQLIEHKLMTSPGTDRITVTRIHNKPNLRATVSGGRVRFGIYITVVSSFASDLDAALQAEGDSVNLSRDKGMPITAYELTTGLWSFLRTKDGRLQVDVPALMQVSQQAINFQREGVSTSLPSGDSVTHVDYTVPEGKRLFWTGGVGTATAWCKWEVKIDGVRWLTRRNAFDKPEVDLHLGQPFILEAGQRILVTVENTSPYATWFANVSSTIYGALEDVEV